MSAAKRTDELLDEAIALIRAYGLRRYGVVPVSVAFGLPDGRELVVPVPPLPCAPLPAAPARAARADDRWASGPEPQRLSDCQKVYWPGLGLFGFSPKQAAAVALLWEAAFESDNPEVTEAALLRAAGSDGSRLRDVFRGHRAWDTLIVRGAAGHFRLADLPAVDDAGEGP